MDALTLAHSFLLSDLSAFGFVEAIRIVEGHVDVFAVRLSDDGQPVGRRRHLCRRETGDALFAAPVSGATGLLCVRSSDATAVPLDRALMSPSDYAALIDDWVQALARSVFRDQAPKESVQPPTDQRMEVEEGAILRSRERVLWVTVEDGSIFVSGHEHLQVGGQTVPVARRPWLVTAEPSCFTAETTASRIARAKDAEDLRIFHELISDALTSDETQATAVEEMRAAARASGARAALQEGTGHLASILALASTIDLTTGDPLLVAARRVGEALGVELKAPPERAANAQRDRVGEIARASRLRVRKVVLSNNWWTTDIGPVLGMASPQVDGQPPRPVALVQRKGKTVMLDGDQVVPVTSEVAEQLHPVAFTFYRPFPDRALSALDVARFGLTGGLRDLASILIIGLIVGLLGLLTPYVTGELFQTAIPEADRGLLIQLVGALFAAAVGTAAFHATRGFALLRLESRMDVTVQAAVWDRLLKLPTGFFRRFTAGELASRAGAISAIRQLLSGATITSMLSALFSILYVGLMLWYSVTLTLWALALTVIALGATLLASYLQLRHQREVSEIQSRLQGRVLQFLTGLTKLRVAGAEAKAFAHWARDFGTQRALQVRARRTANGLATFNAAFPVLSSLVLFAVVASGDEGPLLPIGTFVAFHAAFGSFTSAVLSLSGAFSSVLAAVPLYEQAEPILSALPEVDDTKADPGELTGRLSVEHATFRYDPNGAPVLRDVTVRAESGEFIALVGPSGSGKSTVLRLLLGFETPEAGSVLFDDHDLAEVDVQAVRRQLGVVLQSGGLMQGDLFTNIVGSTGATHDDAWTAARMAGLDRDIQQMPMGMHTVVSEGGTTLSGGQRQRLLIARAIVNRPRILFFDEATSALDNHTQAIVSRSLETLEATRVVVAHRLSTIQKADRIYVLEKGRVVQQGTYDELLQTPGLFAELAERQIA